MLIKIILTCALILQYSASGTSEIIFTSMDNKLPLIGISLGDINGIGPEVIMKTFMDSRLLNLLTPVVYGNGKIISYYRKILAADSFNYHQIRELNQVKPKTINVLNCWDESVTIKPGSASKEAGAYALRSLEMATNDVIGKKLDGLVTGPINKKSIQQESFDFPRSYRVLSTTLWRKERVDAYDQRKSSNRGGNRTPASERRGHEYNKRADRR